jgi:uncharacterized protein Yka (UPF0111/DUF47 family)
MLERWLSEGELFFEAFEQLGAHAVAGATLLEELLREGQDLEEGARRAKTIEHEGDQVVRQAMEALHRTFVTPLDRDTIHNLLTRLDDVLDLIEATVERLWLFDIQQRLPAAQSLARVLRRGVEELVAALARLREVHSRGGAGQFQEVLDHCAEVHRVENEADQLLRAGLAELFRGGSEALHVIKWKEILQEMEKATDRCETVANIVARIVLERR